MTLATSTLVAFVPTTDLARARHFYQGKLGLRLTREDDYACVFDGGGTDLRVTLVKTLTPQSHTVCGWLVSDVSQTASDLAVAGIACVRFDGMDQDESGVWTAPSGDRIAWFHDPDDNLLSLTQPVAAASSAAH